MSSGVKKIFLLLILVVAILIAGGWFLNTALPNVITGASGAVEKSIKAGTGMDLEINGDGSIGQGSAKTDNSVAMGNGNAVQGFDSSTN